jgi:hypothetical protein
MYWAELVEHVRKRHAISATGGESIELWWDFSDDTMAVHQHQAVIRSGGTYVVSSELGVPRHAWRALRIGAIRFGTLVEDGDRLELRAYLAASGLGRSALDHTLHAIAYEAARLAMEVAHRQASLSAADNAA